MREIKFRAWNVLKNEMVYWDAILSVEFMQEFFDIEAPNGEDWILMQYTGLKDKNGVEVYEGDISKHPQGSPFVVEIPDIYQEGYMDMMDEYEVIGNIYENRELLK